MTTQTADEGSAFGRAEALVKRLEEDAGRVARLVVARGVEVAEDIWAEVQGARKKTSAES